MESHRKSVRFIPDLLDEVKCGRVFFQDDGVFFASLDIDNLFPLRDTGQRLSGQI